MIFSHLISILIVTFTSFSFILANSDDIEAISRAISETIENFEPKSIRQLEILILGELSGHLNDILNDVSKLTLEVPKVVRHISVDWRENIKTSTVILTKRVKHLNQLDNLQMGTEVQSSRNLKLFIYCEQLTIRNLIFMTKPEQLFYEIGHASEFAFFFIDDEP